MELFGKPTWLFLLSLFLSPAASAENSCEAFVSQQMKDLALCQNPKDNLFNHHSSYSSPCSGLNKQVVYTNPNQLSADLKKWNLLIPVTDCESLKNYARWVPSASGSAPSSGASGAGTVRSTR